MFIVQLLSLYILTDIMYIIALRTTTHHLKSLNTQKKSTLMEIHVLAWNRHKNVVGLNRFMGSQPSLLIIGIQICTDNEKPAKFASTQKDHILSQK